MALQSSKSIIDINSLAQLRQFFLECCTPPRCQAARQDVQDDSGQAGRVLWTQEVDVLLLLNLVPSLGNYIFTRTLDVLDELRRTCATLCNEGKHMLDANDLSIRFTHLPTLGHALPTMPPPHGQLVQVCGSIVRMTTKRVIPYLYRAMCPRCHTVREMRSNPFDRAAQSHPRCDNSGCKKEEMQTVGQVWMDYAECRLQQRSNQSGQMPRSILVTLDDELSTRCTVGQFVEVIGLLFQKWRNVFPLSRPGIEPAIWAINVLPMEAYRGATMRSNTFSLSNSTLYQHAPHSHSPSSHYSNYDNGNDNHEENQNQETHDNGSIDSVNNKDKNSASLSGQSRHWRSREIHSHTHYTEMGKFNPEMFFNSFHGNLRCRDVALVNSVCPQLAGLFAPRMSLLLSALGGANTTAHSRRNTQHSNHDDNNDNNKSSNRTPLPMAESSSSSSSMHIRSTIHCLFVGDPATGKSQLLQFAASIAPRCTSTSGTGSTAAGLTVAASKEHGEWILEPGALVLSDGGTCVIDELRTVSPSDRAALHEAMEQQTISVAKAGVVTTLRTSCAVLSACNPPHNNSSNNAKMVIELGVGGPLLSRFDFIFLLWDSPLPSEDERIAEHILSCNLLATNNSSSTSSNNNNNTNRVKMMQWDNTVIPPLSMEEVAQYLWWVRGQYANVEGPLLNDEAAELLATYYELQRCRGSSASLNEAVPVTVRLLESLVRITQAHAKLHLQPVCTIYNAAMAVFLMERTAHSLKCPLNHPDYSSGIANNYYTNSIEGQSVNDNNDDNDNDNNGVCDDRDDNYKRNITHEEEITICSNNKNNKEENLYSSSRVLDRLFLDDSEEALHDQGEVLMLLVEMLNQSHVHEALWNEYDDTHNTHYNGSNNSHNNSFDDNNNNDKSNNDEFHNSNISLKRRDLCSTFAELRESEFASETLLDTRKKGPLLCQTRMSNNNSNNGTREEKRHELNHLTYSNSRNDYNNNCQADKGENGNVLSILEEPAITTACNTTTSLTPTNRDNDLIMESVTPKRSSVSSTVVNSSTGTLNSGASNFVHNLHTPHNSPYSHIQYDRDAFALHHSHSPQSLLALQLAESTSGMRMKMRKKTGKEVEDTRITNNSNINNSNCEGNYFGITRFASEVELRERDSNQANAHINSYSPKQNAATTVTPNKQMLESNEKDNQYKYNNNTRSNTNNSSNNTTIIKNNMTDKIPKRVRSLDEIAKNLRFRF